MKKLLCLAAFLALCGLAKAYSISSEIEITKQVFCTIEEGEQLKRIAPKYTDWFNSYIVSLKQGMTNSYDVLIWVEQVDAPMLSAYVVKPNAEIVTLIKDGPNSFYSDTGGPPEFYISIGDLESYWPSGVYQLVVTFTDGHTQTFTTTVPDYDTTPFPDTVSGSVSTGTGGQLFLNCSTVDGVYEYAITVSDIKKEKDIYESGNVSLTPPQSVTTPLTGAYAGKGDYSICVEAYNYVVNSEEIHVGFNTQANWWSFKKPAVSITNSIDKLTVKAGVPSASKDSLSFAGMLDAIAADLIIAEGDDIVVTINADEMTSPLEFTFPISNTTFKKGVYAGTNTEKNVSFKLDTKTGKMTFNAKNIDLTGLACPIEITITIVDYEADFEVDEDIANGNKALPLTLLMGVTDSITVSKVTPKHTTARDADSLTVTGTFTIAGDYDKTNDFAVTVGGQTFTVLGSQMVNKGLTESCSNVICKEGSPMKMTAKLDFAKCTFMIKLTGVNLDPGEQTFGINIFGITLQVEDKTAYHVFDISLTYSWDYDSPDNSLDTEYVFYAESYTDNTINRIEFTTPAGNTFEIPNTPLTEYSIAGGTLEIGREYDDEKGQYYWYYSPRFTDPDSLSAYGDGLYSFTFYRTDGSRNHTTAWFGIPGSSNPIPQPTQIPVFTSFENGDTVTSPVTFRWQACTDPAASSVEFDLSHENGEEMGFQLLLNATTIKPLNMTAGFWEDVELSFERNYRTQNSDGITIFASKYSESDYYLTIEQ
jgi:hypothetical protein